MGSNYVLRFRVVPSFENCSIIDQNKCVLSKSCLLFQYYTGTRLFQYVYTGILTLTASWRIALISSWFTRNTKRRPAICVRNNQLNTICKTPEWRMTNVLIRSYTFYHVRAQQWVHRVQTIYCFRNFRCAEMTIQW